MRKILTAISTLLLVTSIHAGTVTYNFDSDPSSLLQILGNNPEPWQAKGGNPATGGFLAVTYAENNQNSHIIFPDLDPGKVVTSFTFECDLRVGNPTRGDGRPADGFSINFARAGDPVLALKDSDPGRGYAGDTMSGFGFENGSLPETGVITGIAISFDTWQGNRLPDTTDIEGIIVRVDNKTILKQAMPTRNGACDNNTSLQTGPQDLDYWTNGGDAHSPDAWKTLCWQSFKVVLDDSGKLSVTYKGRALLDKFQTTFFPSPGRLVLGGRTGGANENTHIDNIKLTTVSEVGRFLITGLSADFDGITMTTLDLSGSVVDPKSISLKLDGVAITPKVTKSGDTTTIRYDAAPKYLAPGSTHTIDYSIKDPQGNERAGTRQFQVSQYALLTPDLKVTPDTSKPGFLWRVYQVSSGQANNNARTERQLAGLLGDNVADASATGVASSPGKPGGAKDPIEFEVPTVINMSQNGSDNAGHFTTDDVMPGIPGTGGSTDNIAAEIITYIQFPTAGLYTMGVNSDDGFRTTAGDALGLAGEFDGGRGAADTLFTVLVAEPGTFPLRTIWEEGGGGANIEWFTVTKDANGANVYHLINDTSDAQALKSYRAVVGGLRPAIKTVAPGVNAQNVLANSSISVGIQEAGIAVDQASIELKLDGTVSKPTVSKAGNLVTAQFTPATAFAANSSHTVEIAFTDKGSPAQTRNAKWSFTVEDYPTIAANALLDDSKLDRTKKGFLVAPYGTEDNNPNNNAWTEEALAGKHGANTANLTGADSKGFFAVTDVINFDIGAGNGNFTTATGRADKPLPGFPGSQSRDGGTGNAIEEILTLIEFPSAGFYVMGVNSDDGFKVTTAAPDPRPPANALLLGQFDGGRGAADTIFGFKVEAAGVAALRLLWENGGGGANLEWFTVQPDGTKVLVNDSTAGALKAYQFQALAVKSVTTKPTLGIARAGGQLTVTFTGTLQSADAITGPWADVTNAKSPLSVTTTGTKFYRAKQ